MPKFRVLLASALTCAVLAPTFGAPVAGAATTTTVSLDSTQKIHPLLQYGAAAGPTALARVIVQKTSTSVSASSLVPAAQIIEEFSLIPAFVAIVPQASLAQLAQNPTVRYVSPDGPVQVLPGLAAQATVTTSPTPPLKSVVPPKTSYTDANLLTTFPIDTGGSAAWTAAYGSETGTKISVAVIDSGVDANHPDLAGQVIAVNVNKNTSSTGDGYGHGTHVSAIAMGHDPAQHYLGIAPNSTLISVKVADDAGKAFESDLLRGLDWVESNASAYKIRVVNLSVSTAVPESYATSAIDAAVERLWHDGVTVVAAAGNLGSAQDAVWYAPGNDPYVITVGCLDDNATTGFTDDSLCPISSRGATEDGFAKPDLVAPGRRIVSALGTAPNGLDAELAAEFPDRISADGVHLRLSGTSMAAPEVAGAVALLLQRNGGLVPDQLKQILIQTARAYPGQADAAGMLNITAALLASDKPPKTAQVPTPISGMAPPSGSTTLLWDGSRWTGTYFDGSRWTSTYFDGSRWGAAEWDGSRWTSAYWDGSRWTNTYFDGSRWSGATWDSGASLD